MSSVDLERLEVRNDQGEVVMLQGTLPDGTFGIVADESRPFTNEELTDAGKYEEHMVDLRKRIGERLSSYDEND